MAQEISVDFKMIAKATTFNKPLYEVVPSAVYKGGTMTYSSATEVTVDAGLVAFVMDTASKLAVRVELLDPSAPLTVTQLYCYVVIRFTWVDTTGLEATFAAVAYNPDWTETGVGYMQPNDVVLGRVQYQGAALQTAFDYSCQTKAHTKWNPEAYALKLFPHPDPVEKTKVILKAGEAWINGAHVRLTDDAVSVAVSDTTTLGRADLVTLKADGTIAVHEGVPDAAPVPPSCPPLELPVGYIVRGASRGEVNESDITRIAVTRSMHDYLPIGAVIMFDGPSWVNDTTMKGWFACDGLNGTPNMVDRFVMGGAASGATGGTNAFTLTGAHLPSHSHGVGTLAVSSTAATVNASAPASLTYYGGEHSHFTVRLVGSNTSISSAYAIAEERTGAGDNSYVLRGAGSGTWAGLTTTASSHYHELPTHTHTSPPHAHSLSGSTAATAAASAFDNRPAYYTAIYIKRMA